MLSVVETGEFGLLEPLDREIQVEPKRSADPRRRRLRRWGRQEKTPKLIQVRLPPRDGVVRPSLETALHCSHIKKGSTCIDET